MTADSQTALLPAVVLLSLTLVAATRLLILHILFTVISVFPPLPKWLLTESFEGSSLSMQHGTAVAHLTEASLQLQHILETRTLSEAFCFRKIGLCDLIAPLPSLQEPLSLQFSLDRAHDRPRRLHPSYSCLTDTHLIEVSITSLSDFQMSVPLLSPLLPPLTLPRGSQEATTKPRHCSLSRTL